LASLFRDLAFDFSITFFKRPSNHPLHAPNTQRTWSKPLQPQPLSNKYTGKIENVNAELAGGRGAQAKLDQADNGVDDNTVDKPPQAAEQSNRDRGHNKRRAQHNHRLRSPLKLTNLNRPLNISVSYRLDACCPLTIHRIFTAYSPHKKKPHSEERGFMGAVSPSTIAYSAN